MCSSVGFAVEIECCRARERVVDAHVDAFAPGDGTPGVVLERNGSLVSGFLRPAYILFFTRTDRAADATDGDPDGDVADRVDTGHRGPSPVDLVAACAHDGIADAVRERERRHVEIDRGASRVAEQCPGRVPQLALEPVPPDLGVRSALQPHGEVPPAGPQMLREVSHDRTEGPRRLKGVETFTIRRYHQTDRARAQDSENGQHRSGTPP